MSLSQRLPVPGDLQWDVLGYVVMERPAMTARQIAMSAGVPVKSVTMALASLRGLKLVNEYAGPDVPLATTKAGTKWFRFVDDFGGGQGATLDTIVKGGRTPALKRDAASRA